MVFKIKYLGVIGASVDSGDRWRGQ